MFVPKARVTVRDQQTNASREVETNEHGDYTVPLLPPALYRVTVEKPGFRRSVLSNVYLQVERCSPVTIRPNSAAAAARRSTWF